MVFVNAQDVSTEDLARFDKMMLLCAASIQDPNDFAPFATSIWTETLKELDLRGKISLLTGTYDNPFDARISRSY